MGFNDKDNSLKYWDNIHIQYERNEIKLDDWLDKFETIIDNCSTPVLDLGCGSGNDTLYLINKNKQVNSINDVNHGAGQGNEIEHHLYETSDKRLKRFFDEKDIRFFFKDFDIEYLNEEIMTRYKLEKRLYRVCVKKK